MTPACFQINNVNLIYFDNGKLGMRICCTNSTILGDMVKDDIEPVMARREELRQNFLRDHLIHRNCEDNCISVSQMKQAGWKRQGDPNGQA